MSDEYVCTGINDVISHYGENNERRGGERWKEGVKVEEESEGWWLEGLSEEQWDGGGGGCHMGFSIRGLYQTRREEWPDCPAQIWQPPAQARSLSAKN